MTRNRRADPTLLLPSEPPPGMGASRLVIAPGTPSERTVPIGELLARGPLVIGSDPDADIVIDDPHVSGRHFQIKLAEVGVELADLGSRNGTKVQGLAVQGALLEPGVVITIGMTHISYEEDPATDGDDDDLDLVGPARFGGAIGAAPAMRRVFGLLQRIAPADLTITILGETGSGKDVLARAIHEASARAGGPFVVFDCGAVARTLIESELFGHERGAFTGAVDERRGAFERAHGGTLFLDEIGELPLDLQPKLLRVLEQRTVQRLGSGTERAVDVRIVCATNRDLAAEVAANRFRQDLFFRINAAVVHLPPLRERREDLLRLVQHFAADKPGLVVSAEALSILQSYDWPGNVRELRNVMQSAVAVSDGRLLKPRDFILFSGAGRREPTLDGLPLAGRSLDAIEAAAIRQTLQQCAGNKTQAAKALGIAPSTLYAKLKKYGLA
ncbi:MAG TPA: sigma 54-interacting transcriptional regulator [Kofleriaceae bacterium]|nr:sigma 54-interacting transcriptional regulator [Kofleriaceae bacterium]